MESEGMKGDYMDYTTDPEIVHSAFEMAAAMAKWNCPKDDEDQLRLYENFLLHRERHIALLRARFAAKAAEVRREKTRHG